MNGRLRGELAALGLAWQFLTRVPLPVTIAPSRRRMARSVRYLPLAGGAVGLVAAAVLIAAGSILPAVPAVLISTAAAVALTGALHEDGLADTLDGLGGAGRSRALAIMRDSRIGSFGALGLGLTLALKVAALAALPALVAAAALVAGHAASRLSAVLVIATSRYLRPEGTARFTERGVGRTGLAIAGMTGLAALVLAGLAAGAGAALAGAAGLALGHLLARGLFERRLGGYTGDCLGATQQLSEVGFYLGVLAWLSILARHPRPAPGHEGRCYGRLDIAPGADPAAVAAILGNARRIDRIVTSPSARCRRPAMLIARRLRLPLRVDPAWAEMDFGAWEGLEWEAVPRAGLDAWAADLVHARPHGGESVGMLLARVRRGLRRLPGRGRTLVLTHAGPIRAALFAHGAGAAAWSRPVPFGGIVTLGRRR